MGFLDKLFKTKQNDSIADIIKPTKHDDTDLQKANALYEQATQRHQDGEHEAAVTLLLEAAVLGLADAQRSLAVMHCNGLGV